MARKVVKNEVKDVLNINTESEKNLSVKDEFLKVKKATNKTKKPNSSNKVSSAKKETSKAGSKVTKAKTLASDKKNATKIISPENIDSKVSTSKKSRSKKDISNAKAITKINETKKNSSLSKVSTSRNGLSKSKKKDFITAKNMLPEYYDLPYRYNETIVKILAQTPTTLFVYWDISDSDRASLISMYDENFFYETRPILIVHNMTQNYSFEIEINDFANSWYIRTQEPNCNYVIELGRRFNRQDSKYVYINSSNNIISPNDHILFEKADLGNVLFRNVKTNKLSSKDFGSLRFINNIDKLYGNIYDVYSVLYNDDLYKEFSNPSSGEFNFKR